MSFINGIVYGEDFQFHRGGVKARQGRFADGRIREVYIDGKKAAAAVFAGQ